MGPEEEAGPTLVGGVQGGPTQADQEHGPTSLHLLGSGSQEGRQISLELLPVGAGGALAGAVDEHSSFVVRA